ncbi:hypothetical protein ACG83_18845 [Frankia sp. R43]|nr:hypothetical protein ACG83_18845 [Frankia sp. R43]
MPTASAHTASVRAAPDLAGLEADLVEAAFDGAGWGTLLGLLATATGRVFRLLDLTGALLAASEPSTPRGPVAGSSAVALAALLVRPALGPAAVVCRDGWRGHGGPVRIGQRYLGALLLDADQAYADRLVEAAATALAIVALRRDAHAAGLARGVDVVIDDLRHGAIRPAAEFVRVAESAGLDVRIPHAGAALWHRGSDQDAWVRACEVIGFPVLRDGDRAWTLLSGDVPAELGRLTRHLAFQLGSPGAVLAAAGPVVPGDPVDPSETATSFGAADTVLALLRAGHAQAGHPVRDATAARGGASARDDRSRPGDRERTSLLFDDLGLERLLVGLPPQRLRAFTERTLAGLTPADVDLLRAWLETDGSLDATAACLGASPARMRRRLPALVAGLAGPVAEIPVGRLTDLHAATLARRFAALFSAET